MAGCPERIAIETRGDHRDVVGAAELVGPVDQTLADRPHVLLLIRRARNLRGAHHPREPVAAENQRIAAAELLMR